MRQGKENLKKTIQKEFLPRRCIERVRYGFFGFQTRSYVRFLVHPLRARTQKFTRTRTHTHTHTKVMANLLYACRSLQTIPGKKEKGKGGRERDYSIKTNQCVVYDKLGGVIKHAGCEQRHRSRFRCIMHCWIKEESRDTQRNAFRREKPNPTSYTSRDLGLPPTPNYEFFSGPSTRSSKCTIPCLSWRSWMIL